MYEFQANLGSLIISVQPTQTAPINSQNSPPLLIYGGVAVAVIIALTYYNQVLLKLIIKLVSATNLRRDKRKEKNDIKSG